MELQIRSGFGAIGVVGVEVAGEVGEEYAVVVR